MQTLSFRPRLAATILCLLAVCPAQAADCGKLSTQLDMNLCEGKNFEQADGRLNAVYGKLAAKVSPAGKAKLVDAQRAWIKYRDAQCQFEAFGTNGGSINGMMVSQCMTQMTRDQTARLARQLDCPEGDMSCGAQ